MRAKLPQLSKPSRALALAAFAVALSAAAVAYAGPSSEEPEQPSRGVALDPLNRPDVYNRLPPAKQAALDRMNELREQAKDHPLPKELSASLTTDGKVTPGPTRIPPGYVAAGNGAISYGVCGMDHREDREWSNSWNIKLADREVEVCVVSEGRPGGAGVYVTNRDTLPGMRQPEQRWFPLPEAKGTLAAVGGQGDAVLLQDSNQHQFWFDSVALTYIQAPIR